MTRYYVYYKILGTVKFFKIAIIINRRGKNQIFIYKAE